MNFHSPTLYSLSLLIALAFCSIEIARAEPRDLPLSNMLEVPGRVVTNSKIDRYQMEIDHLVREISSDKAHRTALVGRMDEVTGQLDTLLDQKGRENEKKPSITHGIAAVSYTHLTLPTILLV